MANVLHTYRLISNILSYSSEDELLKHVLEHKSTDFDSLVKVGSAQLVLPAIYCRLKHKKLLNRLPEDLQFYLNEIACLNRNRNEAILKQSSELVKIFDAHNVNYCFLKGTALLVGNYFEDIAERMIGDIDIAVDKEQLNMVFELLQNNGYQATEHTFGNTFVEHKHLPRLKTTHYIAAVELHRKLFINYTFEGLSTSDILNTKTTHNGFCIPSSNTLFNHCILNFQKNDMGDIYKTLNFRCSYDIEVLKLKSLNLKNEKRNRYIQSYLKLHTLFFKTKFPGSGHISNWQKKYFFFLLKNNKLYKYRLKFLNRYNYVKILFSKLYLFFTKYEYRLNAWNDRHRIFSLLRKKFL